MEDMNCFSEGVEQFLPSNVTIEDKINVLLFDNCQHQRRKTNVQGRCRLPFRSQ